METNSVMLLLAGGVLVLFLLLRAWRREGEEKQAGEPDAEHRSSHHAVEIRTPDGGCAMVHALEGKRFLSSEAPPIPLPSCRHEACACYYVHHEDRRAAQRRTVHAPKAVLERESDVERRASAGRRAADRMLFGAGH